MLEYGMNELRRIHTLKIQLRETLIKCTVIDLGANREMR